MNKKVSTIFAMAALMGGVFSGSAYATVFPGGGDAVKSVKTNDVVLLGQSSNPSIYLGINKTNDDKSATTTLKGEDVSSVLNFTWNVKVISPEQSTTYPLYVFVNAITGDTLSINQNGQGLLFADKDNNIYAKDGFYKFRFANNGGTAGATYSGENQFLIADANEMALDLVSQSLVNPLVAGPISLSKLNTISADVAKLNALYNSFGFNLAVKPELANVEVQNNLFGTEKRVWAFKVTDDYELTEKEQSEKDLIIPAGVYFFTDPVFTESNYNESNVTDPSQIDWLASTLIALSSTETQEGTDADRANGAGFILVEKVGTDFKYRENASEAQGDDLWISNACFTVTDNFAANDSYPYQLSVENFWYQKSAAFKGEDKQSKATAKLSVTSYENSYQHLVSYTGSAAKHIFRLQASSVVAGKDLLKTTKEAAVYTIQFVNSTFNGKYLTVGKGNSGFQFEAKGAAIADTDYPAFQFVITAVDKDNKVTFTNRETGLQIKTMLFKEDGENRYSLSATDNVQGYTVNTKGANTYEVAKDPSTMRAINPSMIVKLTPVEVDPYAGFLNVDNKTIRTLAFARDQHDTSNMLYAQVNSDNELDDEIFTNDINSAAQWQLVKIGEAEEISRVYVYYNENTKSIDNAPEGDKVMAYKYKLQYINDGSETGKYLSEVTSAPAALKSVGSADEFIIKENVDGSVSLINADNAFTSKSTTNPTISVAKASTLKAVEIKLNDNDEYVYDNADAVYESTSEAKYIKTYLADQPADISWPANEGHVTIESELGNYITMNEDRDAIVVNENEADTYYLYVTDKNAVVPSFYITKGVAAENGERMFMFNPKDSVAYYVADGTYDKKYQWAENTTKVIFKAATINETRDTLTMNVKGETKKVAKTASNNDKNIWGGLNYFKFQIIEAADADGYYYIRQLNSGNEYATTDMNGDPILVAANYLSAQNDKVTWSDKQHALLFTVEGAAAPTANEGVSATEVKIIATDGAINIKNAAGKNVVVSTILGQIVANEVLTSDNATISVPAGIVIVSVDGEEAVKVNVK